MTDLADFTRAFHAHRTADANARLHLGLDRDLDALPDPSAAAHRARAARARDLLSQLVDVDRAPLGHDDRLDLDLARLELEREVHDLQRTFNGATAWQQRPDAGDQIGDPFFMLMVSDPRPDAERLHDVTRRLEQVPAYLQDTLERLTVPVARWVAIEDQKIAALPDLLDNLIAWGDRVGFAEQATLVAATDHARQALATYRKALAALPTTTSFAVGDSAARAIVHLRGIELSLEELHRIAARFLADTRALLETLRQRILARRGLPSDWTVRQLQEELLRTSQVQVPDGRLEAVLDRYTEERERLLAFLEARDLFPIPEDQDLTILRTPSFLEPSIPAGAMVSPPPFRKGIRRSLVYLTLSAELLDEHTELGIPGMMLHEGIPGHHLQLSWAAGHRSVLRRHVFAMDQAEGWTTMLEDYILDQGYMGDQTDEARFIGKLDLSRIGARVAIDLFFMTGDRRYLDVGVPFDAASDDPFDLAGALLQAVTGFTPGRVQAELNWYSLERGYPLSYLAGNHLVWALKRDVQAHLTDLDALEVDRRFHRAFLEAGSMPVSFLRRTFIAQGLLPA